MQVMRYYHKKSDSLRGNTNYLQLNISLNTNEAQIFMLKNWNIIENLQKVKNLNLYLMIHFDELI